MSATPFDRRAPAVAARGEAHGDARARGPLDAGGLAGPTGGVPERAPARPGPRLETRGARLRGQALDVSELPTHGFSHRSLTWWGTLGVSAIEGTVFALAVAAYFYLWIHASAWPIGAPPPDWGWGLLNTAVMMASALPNHWTKKAAEAYDLRRVRIGLVVCLGFAVVFVGVRVLEFGALNCRWDTSAYGSIVWMLLALHTVHLVTDAYDTAVLAVLMRTGPIEDQRFVDASENAFYWYFVIGAWLPIAAVIYVAPRVL